jgi:hypothetical protein
MSDPTAQLGTAQLGSMQLAAIGAEFETDRLAGDAGQSQETVTLNAAIFATELGVGAEALDAPIEAFETGAGSEIGIVGQRAIEYGTGQYRDASCPPIHNPVMEGFPVCDQFGTCVELGVIEPSSSAPAEAGVGVDAASALGAHAATETNAAAVEVLLAGPDTGEAGSAAVTFSIEATITAAQTGIGVDYAEAGPLALDSGVGVELFPAGFLDVVLPGATDTGSGTDALALTLPITDRGSGSESASVTNGPELSSAGVGSDVAQSGALLTLAESATGVEALLLVVDIVSGDTGGGVESIGGLTAAIEAVETGTFAEFCWD